MKLYIKRNPNELAELAFREQCIINYSMLYHFIAKFHKIKNTRNDSPNFYSYFKFNDKYYLGECHKDQLDELLNSFKMKGSVSLLTHLEIIE